VELGRLLVEQRVVGGAGVGVALLEIRITFDERQRCAAACCASCLRNASASAAIAGSAANRSAAIRIAPTMYRSNGTAMKVKALQNNPKSGLAGCHMNGTEASNSQLILRITSLVTAAALRTGRNG
jgi:hypothetical protein